MSSFSILFWTESRCLIWHPGAWRSLLSTQPWQLPWLWVLSLLVNNYQVNKRARWHIGNLMSLNLGVLRSAGYHLEFQTIPLLCNTEVSYFLWMCTSSDSCCFRWIIRRITSAINCITICAKNCCFYDFDNEVKKKWKQIPVCNMKQHNWLLLYS